MDSHEIDWNGAKDCLLAIKDIKPNYNMTFHKDGKQIGAMDWNGPAMTFSGDVEESAKVFFDWIAEAFKSRLEQERAAEREACAKVCDALAEGWKKYPGKDDSGFIALSNAGVTIRAKGNS